MFIVGGTTAALPGQAAIGQGDAFVGNALGGRLELAAIFDDERLPLDV